MYFNSQDGVRLYFDDYGHGEPVVMLHGAAGSGKSFDTLAELLRRSFRVVTLDLRGLSRSDRVDTIGATAWCDDTLDIVDSLGLGTFHLIGCSLGARIASRIARDNAGRVMSLSVDAPLLSVAQGAATSLNRRFEDFEHASAEDVEKWQRYHGDDWRETVSFYGRIRNNSELQEHLTIESWLHELTLPTLITRGDKDDPVHPLSHCMKWHTMHPSSWLWISPDTSFSLTQRQPEQYAEIFQRFMTTTNHQR